MNIRNVLVLTFAVAIVAVITGATVTALSAVQGAQEVDAKQKSCASQKFSHCKGTPHYYIKGTHHHCVKGVDKNCYKK